MRRVSQQEWENEHMHNPMTEGEALAVLDVDAIASSLVDWMLTKAMPNGDLLHASVACDYAGMANFKRAVSKQLRAALTAHTAASGGEVVAERHQLYGIRWIKQLREMEPGTQWFIEGRSAPIATVLSNAGVQWHTAESEIPHGTKYYTRPPAAVPADALAHACDRVDGVIQYASDTLSGPEERMSDRAGWYRGGVVEILRRVRAVKAELADIAALIPKGADHV